VLGDELARLAGSLGRLHDAEPTAVVGRQGIGPAAEQPIERHPGLARQRVVERHVEHRQRHLRQTLMADMGEPLLAGIVRGRRVFDTDLAALESRDQLVEQDRHDLLRERDEREAQRPSRAAAFRLQVDQQERPMGESADARIQRPAQRDACGTRANAGDLDGRCHACAYLLGAVASAKFGGGLIA